MTGEITSYEPYQSFTYYGLAVDPIHVGMGGYRLGEVDLAIVRDPGTGLPKIPGSSLEGSARAYTALGTINSGDNKYSRKMIWDVSTNSLRDPTEEELKSTPRVSCAGKGGKSGDGHCGLIDCPVCTTYGFTIGSQNRSFHGLAQFYDATILFFPVHTMMGPVWITSPRILKDDFQIERNLSDQLKIKVGSSLVLQSAGLNLGWIYLLKEQDPLEIADFTNRIPSDLEKICERLVLVSDDLFSAIVNSNLEVRTSVSIDPATGAAVNQALFTYEALPRGTVLHMPITILNPAHFQFPKYANKTIIPTPFDTDFTISKVSSFVDNGLRFMKFLGVGGMNTRGFGRLRIYKETGGEL